MKYLMLAFCGGFTFKACKSFQECFDLPSIKWNDHNKSIESNYGTQRSNITSWL